MDDGLKVSNLKDSCKYFGYTEEEIEQMEGSFILHPYLILILI